MSILITGGTGFLGSALARALIMEGKDIILFDVAPDYEEVEDISSKVEVIQGDITTWVDLVNTIKKYDVKDIFHLAAILTVPAENRPLMALNVNLHGTINVLEAARLFDVKKVIYASTASTFGPDVPQPVNENSIQRPRTAYGVTKLFGELWGLYYHYRYGIDFRALRFPSLIGGKPSRAMKRATAYATLMIQKSALGEPCEVDVDEEQIAQLLYYKDAVNALILFYKTEKPKSRIYNLGGILLTAREIADAVYKYIPDACIKFAPKPQIRNLLSWPAMDSKKIEEELGWKICYPLNDLIKDYAEEVRKGSS